MIIVMNPPTAVMQVWHYGNYCSYLDINECLEDTDNCAQTCTDTDGSYTCSCDAGYELANDGLQCDG